jgi:hypothetical protein
MLAVRVVEGMDGSAALYAQSLQGHHVAVLAKVRHISSLVVRVSCACKYCAGVRLCARMLPHIFMRELHSWPPLRHGHSLHLSYLFAPNSIIIQRPSKAVCQERIRT